VKAVLCKELGPVESLVVEDVPARKPGRGEVVIAVRAAGVNFPDVLIVQGKYQFKPELPFSPGNEVAGVVTAIGADVERVAVGDRVISAMLWGAFAEEVVVDQHAVIALPDAISFEVGACLITAYATTIYALKERAELQPGETLAVLGASGGVGLAAVQLGKLMGARVIACASTAEKLALCREHGADEVINYSEENLKQRLKELSNGGVDVVYDPVGGQLSEQAVRALAWGGRLLVVGFASGDIPNIPLNLVLLKSCQLVGVFWGAFSTRDPKRNQQLFGQVLEWVANGKLQPLVSKTYALSEASQALDDMANRRVRGKVALVVDEPPHAAGG